MSDSKPFSFPPGEEKTLQNKNPDGNQTQKKSAEFFSFKHSSGDRNARPVEVSAVWLRALRGFDCKKNTTEQLLREAEQTNKPISSIADYFAFPPFFFYISFSASTSVICIVFLLCKLVLLKYQLRGALNNWKQQQRRHFGEDWGEVRGRAATWPLGRQATTAFVGAGNGYGR